MANKNKKVVQMQRPGKHGMMDQAVKDIMDVSEEVVNQLEMKRGMMQTVLDTVEAGFEKNGLSVQLRLATEGYEFLFSDLQDYLSDEEEEDMVDLFDFDEEEEEEDNGPVEMFGGEDQDGNAYSVMVMLVQNPEDEDSFDMNIAVIRERNGQTELMTDDGWEEPEFLL